ncbi:(ZYRO0G12672g) [Zygosaccharomyces parabailii]|nr:(ZYRO0G12672g) [Zygosaccharomyces parabailii]
MTLPYNPDNFKQYQPVIEAYVKARDQAMQKFDPEFYAACIEKLPSQHELDTQPINATEFVTARYGLLSAKEAAIVNDFPLPELLSKQLSGQLTAVQIARAFIKSAIIAQLATNCVMEFLFPEALEKAASLDAYLQQHGTLRGPLHGIPVSLKEHMCMKGHVTHASYVSLLGNVTENTCVTIQMLADMGAVFHVRTSQPQAIMHLDTDNNIIGRTRNPCSTMLSPGGSSGGESAMIAMHGSVLGIGSDIGGSIRAPAAFANIYGLRPTSKRFSGMNAISGGKGQESVPATMGPLARSLDELDALMNYYVNESKPWLYDPTCIPLPWDTKPELPAKIRIGVLFSDHLVTPFPAVTNAMKHVTEKLAQLPEFEVVDLDPYWLSEEEMTQAIDTVCTLYICDGNRQQQELIHKSGEPLLALTEFFFNPYGGNDALSVYENRKLNLVRDNMRLQVFQRVFPHCDFILSPTYFAPSEQPHESFYWGYTSFWNLTDYPNVVFPTPYGHHVERDATIPTLRDNRYEKVAWNGPTGRQLRYDSSKYEGGPVALQLTGPRFRDETVVAAAKKITAAIKIDRR